MTEKKRYDVLLVPENLDRLIAPRGGEAYMRYLATARVCRPTDEAIAEEWVEVYCQPDASSHEPFVIGGYSSDEPVYLEAAVRLGAKPVEIPFGVEGQKVNFFIEFRGCIFDTVMGKFLNRFKEILYVRPRVFVREHTALTPHREVPEDEIPIGKPKSKAGPGNAGTRVEEW